MKRRIKKQILYGSLFFIIFIIFIVIVYYSFKPGASCYNKRKDPGEEGIDCGGPCIPCEIFSLKKLKTSDVKILIYPDNTMDLIASVENPNDNYGVKKFYYEFLIYGENNKIIKLYGENFILPLEKKYILETNKKIPDFRITKVILNINFPLENWVKTEENKVNIEMINYAFDERKFESEVTNSSQVNYKNIELDYLILNERNEIIGALKTFLENLEPASSKTVILTLPPLNEKPYNVIFIPQVNLLEQ